jgi:hypothetical protein
LTIERSQNGATLDDPLFRGDNRFVAEEQNIPWTPVAGLNMLASI